jgi:hypothetical protein
MGRVGGDALSAPYNTIAEWKHVEKRLKKGLSSRKGKLLSIGERLVLINSVFSIMVLQMISFFQLQKRILNRLNLLPNFRSRFFWQDDNDKKSTG